MNDAPLTEAQRAVICVRLLASQLPQSLALTRKHPWLHPQFAAETAYRRRHPIASTAGRDLSCNVSIYAPFTVEMLLRRH